MNLKKKSINPVVLKFIKDSILFSIASIIGFFSSIVRGFIVPNLISVAEYGTFNFFISLNPLFQLLSMGVSNSIPIFICKTEDTPDEHKKIINHGIGVILFSYFIACIMYIFFIYIFFSRIPEWILYLLPIFIAAYFFQEIANYAYGIIRSREHYRTLTFGIIIFNLIYLVLSLILTYFFKLYGLCFSFLISNFIFFFYFITKGYIGKPLIPLWSKINQIVVTGFKQNINTILSGFIMQSDRYMLMYLAGADAVGIYAVAIQVGMLSFVVLNSLGQVFSTKIYIEALKPKETNNLGEIFFSGIFIYSLLAIVLCSIIFFIAQPIIMFFLPKYFDSIRLTKILVWLPILITISNISCMVVISTKRIGKMINLLIIVGIISPLIYYVFWKWLCIIGVSIAIIIISFIICCFYIAVILKNLEEYYFINKYLFPLLAIILYGIITSFLVDYFIVIITFNNSLINIIITALIKIVIEIILLFIALLIVYIYKKNIINSIEQLFLKKIIRNCIYHKTNFL